MRARETSTVPPVGTRPVHRRALILGAGVRLFSEAGYAGVSTAATGRAVTVQPSAT